MVFLPSSNYQGYIFLAIALHLTIKTKTKSNQTKKLLSLGILLLYITYCGTQLVQKTKALHFMNDVQ